MQVCQQSLDQYECDRDYTSLRYEPSQDHISSKTVQCKQQFIPIITL